MSDSPQHHPPRVIHLISSLASAAGGTARVVLALAQALAAADTEVHVLSYETGTVDWPWGDLSPPNLHVTLFPHNGRPQFASPALRERLGQLLTGGNAVLHLHGLWEPMSASAAKLARQRHVPYVSSIHGMLDPWSMQQRALKKRIYYRLIERRRLRRSAALHFTAAQEAQKAAPWIPPGPRQLIIPVLVDLHPFATPVALDAAHAFFPSVPAEAPWILFLSRIHEKKGLDLLVQAVARLTDKRAQLVIAGSGDPAYVTLIKDQVRQAGLVQRTHFVGLVQGAQKISLLRRADLLAIPSSQENFGIVFPEALASGTPVLVTQGVDIHQELVQSQGGLLIRRDPADIAEKISLLLADPAAARARGAAGRRWVFSALAPATITRQWLEAYRDVTQSKSK